MKRNITYKECFLHLENSHNWTENFFLGDESVLRNVRQYRGRIEGPGAEGTVPRGDEPAGQHPCTFNNRVVHQPLVVQHLARTHADSAAVNQRVTFEQ